MTVVTSTSAVNSGMCPLCGSVARSRSWGAYECFSCGSVCAARLPSQAELDQYYAEFNQTYRGGGRGKNQLRYAARYLQVVRSLAPAGELVDVGSSTNPLPRLASQAGYRVTVVDYSRPRNLPPNVAFHRGNLNERGLAGRIGQRFDLVTMFAVIEHCSDVPHAVETLASLCRPGGHIVLTTPEIGTFATNAAVGRSGWWFWPEHLNLVSRKALQCLMERHGCELVRSRRFELTPLRWAARYGIGLMESLVGSIVRGVAPHFWERKREVTTHRFKGIALYVFRRSGGPGDNPARARLGGLK